MARLAEMTNDDNTPNPRAARVRDSIRNRQTVDRNSFFRLPQQQNEGEEQTQTQTFRADDYTEREREIINKAHRHDDDEDEHPTTIDLFDLLRQEDLQEVPVGPGGKEKEWQLALDVMKNGQATTVRIPAKDLEKMTVQKFRDLTMNQPEAMYTLFYSISTAYKNTVEDTLALEEANNHNLEKLAEAQQTVQNAESEAQEAEAEAHGQVTKYKDRAEKYRSLTKDHEATIAQLLETITAHEKTIAEQSAALQTAKSNDRGRPSSRQRPPRRTDSSLSADRRFSKRGTRENPKRIPDRDDPDDDDDDSDDHGRKRKKDAPKKKKHRDTSSPEPGHSKYTTFDSSLITTKTSRDPQAPEKFSGDGKGIEFRHWLNDAENKLMNTVFPSKDAALRQVQSWLKGAARDYVSSKVPSISHAAESDPYGTFDEMIEDLIQRFGEKDAYGKAFSKLEGTKQDEKQSFTEFYVEWRNSSNKVRLPSNVERDMIKNRLNTRYANRLIGKTFATLNELVTYCTELETGFETFDRAHKKTKEDKPKSVTNSSTTATSGNTTASNRSTSNATGPPKKPWSERPQQYQGLQPLNAEINDRLWKEGKCIKCEGTGHRRFDASCPLAAFARRPFAPGYTPPTTRTPNHSSSNADGGSGNASSTA